MTLHIAAMPFFTRHILCVSDSTPGTIFPGRTLVMMASHYLWVPVARRFGRRNGPFAATLLSVTTTVSWFLVSEAGAAPWVQIIGINSGSAGGGVFLGLHTVLTDTMDRARRSQGETQAGMLAGIFMMVGRVTAAFGTFVSATEAGAAAQSPQVRLAIVSALSLVPAAFGLLACVFMLRYRLPGTPDVTATDSGVKPATERPSAR